MQILPILDPPWELLVAVEASPFALWLRAAAIAAVLTYFVAAAGRSAVDAALRGEDGGKPLAPFDLSRGDTAGAMARKTAVAPELLWTYDEDYLYHFAQRAEAVTAWGRPALEVYWKFVLWADVAFAISLAATTVLFWCAVAGVSWTPLWLGRLAIFGECMGLLYGLADVAEDLKLAAILGDPNKTMDSAQAAAANALTRLKFVTNMLSIAGLVFFIAIAVADKASFGLFGLFRRVVPLLWRPARGRAPASR